MELREQLQHYTGKLLAAKLQNIRHGPDSPGRAKVSHLGQDLDAQSFFQQRVEETSAKLAQEHREQESKNLGVCFVMLKSSELAQRFHSNQYFQGIVRERHTEENEIDFTNLVARKPFLEDDIIWENLHKDQAWAAGRRVALLVGLMIFSLLLLTPTYASTLFATVIRSESLAPWE